MGWLSIVIGLIQALPAILQAILAVESAIGAQNGTLKKQMVLAPVVSTNDVKPEFAAAVSKVVDTLVSGLNASGKLSTPPVTPSITPGTVAVAV